VKLPTQQQGESLNSTKANINGSRVWGPNPPKSGWKQDREDLYQCFSRFNIVIVDKESLYTQDIFERALRASIILSNLALRAYAKLLVPTCNSCCASLQQGESDRPALRVRLPASDLRSGDMSRMPDLERGEPAICDA
jgi:hypothetical protein